MTYTVRQIEVLMLRRTKSIMNEVGMDVEPSGVNTDLADPINEALTMMGLYADDPTQPDDADMAAVSQSQLLKLLDLAEYRLLINVYQNFDDVDVRIGHRQEEFSQLANRILMRVDRLRTHIREEYGIGLQALQAGVIDLDLDSSGDDTIAETGGL